MKEQTAESTEPSFSFLAFMLLRVAKSREDHLGGRFLLVLRRVGINLIAIHLAGTLTLVLQRKIYERRRLRHGRATGGDGAEDS